MSVLEIGLCGVVAVLALGVICMAFSLDALGDEFAESITATREDVHKNTMFRLGYRREEINGVPLRELVAVLLEETDKTMEYVPSAVRLVKKSK